MVLGERLFRFAKSWAFLGWAFKKTGGGELEIFPGRKKSKLIWSSIYNFFNAMACFQTACRAE
jgi:hypothetical protein